MKFALCLRASRAAVKHAKYPVTENYALHAKIYVFDRQRLFIGSWNYDQCSLRSNTEIGLLMDSLELAQQVVKRFEQMTVPAASYKLVLGTGALGRRRVSWDTEINQEKS